MPTWAESLSYAWDQFTYGFMVKSGIATILTFLCHYFGIKHQVLGIYLLFSGIDLVFGIIHAVVYNNFSSTRLVLYLRKLAVQISVVLLLGLACKSMFYISEINITFANWLLFLYIISDFASILAKMDQIGLPIPPAVDIFLLIIRKKAALDLSNFVKDPEIRAVIEKAIVDATVARQTKRGRKSTDVV